MQDMNHDTRAGAASQGSEQRSLSVSAAVALAKGALEKIRIRVIGEVSECKRSPSAVFFTIKDDKAVLPCLIWNNIYDSIGIDLYVGALVEITGSFGVYPQKGNMQFYATRITLAGEGELRMRVAELVRKLQSEGLFAAENKKAIPVYPEKIGLVTSPRGAVVYDVLRTLRRRFPLAEVLIAGVPVEGAQAARALVDGIVEAVHGGAEVVLLVRGGGSFEDMMPFNDERLARTIARCPIPVVTGIGHEPDTSIADMAADLRASTPTAAAEAVSIAADQLALQIDSLEKRLVAAQMNVISVRAVQLQRIESARVFRDPMRLFENEALALDDLEAHLLAALPDRLASSSMQLREYGIRISHSLGSATARPARDVDLLQQRFMMVGEGMLQRFGNQLALSASRLEDLSPLGVVARGYSMARDERGDVVSSVEQVKPDERLSLTVSDGVIDCKVMDVKRIALSLQEI